MKVILLKPVKHLGRIGDVVTVKDGYGRNYLLPNRCAMRATVANIEHFSVIRSDLEQRNSELFSESVVLAEKLSGFVLTFIMQCAADGRLYGSVNSASVVKELSRFGYDVRHSNVILDAPLKSVGIYEVELMLHPEVRIKILVNIARSESEGNDALSFYRSSSERQSEDQSKERSEEQSSEQSEMQKVRA
jgi:large subunit ribosomal protein L9